MKLPKDKVKLQIIKMFNRLFHNILGENENDFFGKLNFTKVKSIR